MENPIIIGERFRKDLGDLTDLAKSIEKVGLLHPIVVTEEGKLVAGMRRLEAWKLLGREEKEIPCTVIPEYLRDAEVQENTVRKEFTLTEMTAIWNHYQPQVAQEAQNRVIANLPNNKNTNVENFPAGKTRDVIGSIVGVSGKTIEKAVTLVGAAKTKPEVYGSILDEVDNGSISLSQGIKKLKIKQKQQEIKAVGSPPMPEGMFDVIYADPPWQYENNRSLRGKADIHYATLPTNEICLLPIQDKIAEDAVLFLWVTNPFIKDGIRVVEEWGFKYKTCMVWVKPHIANGYYVRSQHELLFIGIKGNFSTPADEDRPPSVIHADKGQHSEKPHIVYEIIEKMYPKRRYLELFARNHREGWASWGFEADG